MRARTRQGREKMSLATVPNPRIQPSTESDARPTAGQAVLMGAP